MNVLYLHIMINIFNFPHMADIFKAVTYTVAEVVTYTRFIWFPSKLGLNSPVIRQKGETQNWCFKKTKHVKFSVKRTFITH